MEPSTASRTAAEDGSSEDDTSLRAVLAQRDFRRYAGARFVATVTWQMLGVAVGWQVYDLTRDPLDLGLIGLAQFLPFLALVLPGGQVADRHDRRAVLIAAYATEVVAVLVLLAFTLSGSRETWPVFLAMGLVGAGRAFWMPTGQAMVVNLVPTPLFPRAAAFNATLFQLAMIAGPAVGGVLYALGESSSGTGAVWVYGTALALLALVIGSLLRVRPVRPPPTTAPHSWHELSAGLRFVLSRKPVLGAISLDLFAVLFGGATALLPIIASDILGVGAVGYGVLRAAPGIGAVIVGLVLAGRPIRRQVGPVLLLSVAGFGAFTILMGVSTSYWLSFAALVLLSGSDMVSVYVRSTLTPLLTPAHLRGRVVAVERVFVGASNELGAFESGLLAQYIGTVPAIVVGGGVSIGAAGLWGLFFPGLRRIDRFEDITPARDPDAPPRG